MRQRKATTERVLVVYLLIAIIVLALSLGMVIKTLPALFLKTEATEPYGRETRGRKFLM